MSVQTDYYIPQLAQADRRIAELSAENARLRAALETTRLYMADMPIASAVVIPPGEAPNHRHPTLLGVIDAALASGQRASGD